MVEEAVDRGLKLEEELSISQEATQLAEAALDTAKTGKKEALLQKQLDEVVSLSLDREREMETLQGELEKASKAAPQPQSVEKSASMVSDEE